MVIAGDSLERSCWIAAILGVRTGRSEIGLVCSNDESQDLPHPNKTVSLSLNGYLHYSSTPSMIGSLDEHAFC